MIDVERLTLVAQNEGIDYSAIADLDTEIMRVFDVDRQGSRIVDTSTGYWIVHLSEKEPGVDMVVFEKSNLITPPEITSRQLLINRARVGIGLRTIRATTETVSVIDSDNAAKKDAIKPDNARSLTGINTVKVSEELIVNPELLHYAPTPRSAEHVAQIVTGTTTLLRSLH